MEPRFRRLPVSRLQHQHRFLAHRRSRTLALGQNPDDAASRHLAGDHRNPRGPSREHTVGGMPARELLRFGPRRVTQARRMTAEAVATALLLSAVVGSGPEVKEPWRPPWQWMARFRRGILLMPLTLRARCLSSHRFCRPKTWRALLHGL